MIADIRMAKAIRTLSAVTRNLRATVIAGLILASRPDEDGDHDYWHTPCKGQTMIAKIFYLSTPAPGRYMLNYQLFGSDELITIEIAKAHLVNLLIDGTALALREDQYLNRIPKTQTEEGAHERA